MTMALLPIPTTIRVITRCWTQAEAALRREIKEYAPGSPEEHITRTFHAKFADSLNKASTAGRIDQAFRQDVEALVRARIGEPVDLSELGGLIADVRLHEKPTEEKTGGDLGIVLVRPNVWSDGYELRIDEHKQGLLGQAKVKREDGRWGRFTDNQLKVLPRTLKYLGLLLYEYSDAKRCLLEPFKWQLCAEAPTLQAVEQWLRTGSFPSLFGSQTILEQLGAGRIGTTDQGTLNDVIAPNEKRALVIRVYWPPGKHPGGGIQIYRTPEVETKLHVHQGY